MRSRCGPGVIKHRQPDPSKSNAAVRTILDPGSGSPGIASDQSARKSSGPLALGPIRYLTNMSLIIRYQKEATGTAKMHYTTLYP